MGWYYTLDFKCNVLPEYKELITNEYFQLFYNMFENDIDAYERTYEILPKKYKDIIDIWVCLGLGQNFQKHLLEDETFHCVIEKKVNKHKGGHGDLQKDYEKFLKDIIVPISSEITYCSIDSDDYIRYTYHYTDSQLRNIPFHLADKVKSVEHVYNADGTEIYETRIVYKHSIKNHQFLDLERAYIGK